jgi:hypothetical protein
VLGTILYNKDNWGWGLSMSQILLLNGLFPLVTVLPFVPTLRETELVATTGSKMVALRVSLAPLYCTVLLLYAAVVTVEDCVFACDRLLTVVLLSCHDLASCLAYYFAHVSITAATALVLCNTVSKFAYQLMHACTTMLSGAMVCIDQQAQCKSIFEALSLRAVYVPMAVVFTYNLMQVQLL